MSYIAQDILDYHDRRNDEPSAVCGPCGGKGKLKRWKNEGYGIRYWVICTFCAGEGKIA